MAEHPESTAGRPEKQPYMRRLTDAFRRGVPPRGVLAESHIAHDDDCPMLAGRRYCTCHPDITVRWTDKKGRTHSVEVP